MKIPRNVSGQEVIRMLTTQLAYRIVHQRGSHVVLETDEPSHHRIAILNHKSIRVGTLNVILKSIASHKGSTRDSLIELF